MSARRVTLSAVLAGAVLVAAGTLRAASFEDDFQAMLSDAMQADTRTAVDQKIERARQSLAGRGAFVDAVERQFLEADLLRAHGSAYALLVRRDPKQFRPLLGAARGMLESALGRYRGLEKSFTEQAGKLVETLPEEALEKNREYRQANASTWRAKYRAAWLEYRLAELADPKFDAASRTKHLTAATEVF
ncbi:MAG TPA: hypothetical protein VMX57_05490, partial [Planctomycetota bacterium]|nr:hypothetical protein [Planctomycetota bacterium]